MEEFVTIEQIEIPLPQGKSNEMQGTFHNRAISMNFADAESADRLPVSPAAPIVNKEGCESPQASACVTLRVGHRHPLFTSL